MKPVKFAMIALLSLFAVASQNALHAQSVNLNSVQVMDLDDPVTPEPGPFGPSFPPTIPGPGTPLPLPTGPTSPSNPCPPQ